MPLFSRNWLTGKFWCTVAYLGDSYRKYSWIPQPIRIRLRLLKSFQSPSGRVSFCWIVSQNAWWIKNDSSYSTWYMSNTAVWQLKCSSSAISWSNGPWMERIPFRLEPLVVSSHWSIFTFSLGSTGAIHVRTHWSRHTRSVLWSSSLNTIRDLRTGGYRQPVSV